MLGEFSAVLLPEWLQLFPASFVQILNNEFDEVIDGC